MGGEGHLHLETGRRNVLGTCSGHLHKSRVRMQVGEAVQTRNGDGRSCTKKLPYWRKLKRALGQNRVCR